MTRDRTPEPGAEVCVIGSGFAGTFVAFALAERDHDVVVLEAGPRFDLDDPSVTAEQLERAIRPEYSIADMWEMGGTRDRYTAAVPAHIDFDLNERRVKGVGGTSLSWHGTVMRLHEHDFERQSRYGHAVDWPITYGDLQPYYLEAEYAMGVAGESGPGSPPRDEPFPMAAFPASATDQRYIEACAALDIDVQRVPHARNSQPYDGRAVCEGYGTCSPFCPSSAKYVATVHLSRAETAGARIIDRARVTRIEHEGEGNRATAVSYVTPKGNRYRQEADHFVVACGPIETPRLLLLSSSDSYPDGLANSSGTVGRYLQATPYISTTAVLDGPAQPEHAGFDTSMSYSFYEPTDEHSSIWLTFRNENPTPVIEQILQGGARHVREGLLSELTTNPWGDDLLERVGSREPATFPNVRVSSYVEQLPRAKNRVTLDPSRTDDLGWPVPHIAYAFDEAVDRTMRRALEIHRAIFDEMDAEIVREEAPLRRIGNDHKGTTRMGTDPATSVVDATGRTHDLENLWIGGPSLFPTGGAVQPTLTTVALALKTADHLHDVLAS